VFASVEFVVARSSPWSVCAYNFGCNSNSLRTHDQHTPSCSWVVTSVWFVVARSSPWSVCAYNFGCNSNSFPAHNQRTSSCSPDASMSLSGYKIARSVAGDFEEGFHGFVESVA